jgi:hypothetical protein
MKNHHRWTTVVVLLLALAAFLIGYHDWWRGKPPSLPVLSECLALAGIVGVALALALGPWRRLIGRGDLAWRRPLGVVGAALIAAHVAVQAVLLRSSSPPAWYLAHPLRALTGGIAFALVLALASTLPERRPRLHAWGWVVLAAMLVHIELPVRMQGWLRWFATWNYPAPPSTMLWILLALAVLGLRLSDAWTRPRTP